MALQGLNEDEQRIIFDELFNPLEPSLAVHFSSASRELRKLLTPALQQQLKTAAALCLKVGTSCKALREARKISWVHQGLSMADLTTLGTLGSVLPALEHLRLVEYPAGLACRPCARPRCRRRRPHRRPSSRLSSRSRPRARSPRSPRCPRPRPPESHRSHQRAAQGCRRGSHCRRRRARRRPRRHLAPSPRRYASRRRRRRHAHLRRPVTAHVMLTYFPKPNILYTLYRGFGFPSLQSSFGTRPTGRSAVRPRRTSPFGPLAEHLPGHL